MGPGEGRISGDRLIHQSQRLLVHRPAAGEEVFPAGQVEAVGVARAFGCAAAAGRLLGIHLVGQRGDDDLDDLVLNLEDVRQLTVEALGPEVAFGLAVQQLGGDAHAIAGLAHAALQEVAGRQGCGNVLGLDGASLVLERLVARDNLEGPEARQGGDDVLRHAVGEKGLVRVVGEGREGQDGDGRPRLRLGRRRRLGRPCLRRPVPDLERPGDVLDLLQPAVPPSEIEAVAHLAVGIVREGHPAGRGQGLQAGGQIDPVAEQIAGLVDDVAQMHADTQADRPVTVARQLRRGHVRLKGGDAAHRLDDARKLDQQAVAGRVGDAPAAGGDGRLDHFRPERAQAPQRALLVRAHEPGEAGHVGRHDGGQPAVLARHLVPPRSGAHSSTRAA